MKHKRRCQALGIVSTSVGAACLTLCLLAAAAGESDVPTGPGSEYFVTAVSGRHSIRGRPAVPRRVHAITLTGAIREVKQGVNAPFRSVAVHPTGSVFIEGPGPGVAPWRRHTPEGSAGDDGWARRLETAGLRVAPSAGVRFSPRGDMVAFLALRAEGHLPLVMMSTDGRTLKQIELPRDVNPVLMNWSPDSSMLSFHYFAQSTDYDPHLPTFGLAVAGVEGEVRVLAKPSLVDGRAGAYIYARPYWTPDGGALYFAAGPEAGAEEPSHWPTPGAYCYRIELETGERQLVSPGIPCGISPDGTFILLRDCPGDQVGPDKRGKQRRKRETWRLDLPSMKKTVLPDSIRNPKLSPSGKYIAEPRKAARRELRHFIDFYRTSDWKRIASPEIPGAYMDLGKWPTHTAWVTHP